MAPKMKEAVAVKETTTEVIVNTTDMTFSIAIPCLDRAGIPRETVNKQGVKVKSYKRQEVAVKVRTFKSAADFFKMYATEEAALSALNLAFVESLRESMSDFLKAKYPGEAPVAVDKVSIVRAEMLKEAQIYADAFKMPIPQEDAVAAATAEVNSIQDAFKTGNMTPDEMKAALARLTELFPIVSGK